MGVIIGICALFAIIALIAASGPYKGRESNTAVAVFGGIAILLSILHWGAHVL